MYMRQTDKLVQSALANQAALVLLGPRQVGMNKQENSSFLTLKGGDLESRLIISATNLPQTYNLLI